jgi:exocyst complex protein 7
MASPEEDDTSESVVETLADDMHRIFSKLDGPFSCIDGANNRKNEEFVLPVNLEEELSSLEDKIMKWEGPGFMVAGEGSNSSEETERVYSYLRAVDDVQSLVNGFSQLPDDVKDFTVLQRIEAIFHQAMDCLEEEFRALLEKHSNAVDPDCLFDAASGPSFNSSCDERAFRNLADDEKEEEDVPVAQPVGDLNFTIDSLPSEIVNRLSEIAVRMVRAGYRTECCQVYCMIRKMFLEESVMRLGFEKLSIEEVQRIQWELLEVEISKWMQTLKVSVNVFMSSERILCDRVFVDLPSVSETCFGELARGVMIQFLNFGEAVAISRRSPEKLFKILDMYETLWELIPKINSIFSGEVCSTLRSEASAVWLRLGEAARGTFLELENAIKGDLAKNPVPGGAIHPLTRYVMNYMRLACDYRDTLEQVFKEDGGAEMNGVSARALDHSDVLEFRNGTNTTDSSPLSTKTIAIMELLESNLNAKSKLYKDPALSYVFLMNNGRYIVQKVKDSEIHSLLGDVWVRQHSSNVRRYHKSYQRVAWGKVLSCLRDEGIHVGGNFSSGVSKPVLKERFKNFNALFEELQKTQSTWIVADDQLQTELRISVAEMVIPAYRQFLGRFQYYLENDRHPERYIKYGPEEVEALINELFEGAPSSMTRRKS